MIERSFVCTIISYVRLLYCMNMYARFGGLTRPRDTSGIDAMFEGTRNFFCLFSNFGHLVLIKNWHVRAGWVLIDAIWI